MDNKDNKVELAQQRFMQGVSHLSQVFSLNKFIAQLYVFLYLNAKPFSLDEIAQELGVSKGNVSINIRELEKWGAVRSVWIKGSRKDYYQADPDLKKVFINKAKSSIQKKLGELSAIIAEFNSFLESMDKDLSKEGAKKIAAYKEGLRKIEELKALLVKGIAVVEKFI